jgi:hypothetical protein
MLVDQSQQSPPLITTFMGDSANTNSRSRLISSRVLLLLPWDGCVMIVLWGGCHWQKNVLLVSALDLVVAVVVQTQTVAMANTVVARMEEEEQ